MFYEGPVWYRREFIYHKRANTRVFVYFGAANYQSTVYLNGEKLGEHEGGFTAFNFEATSVLREGDNFLIVEVSNARRADAVPALKFDWWSYGGITRDVLLVEVPTVFIQDYSVQLAKSAQNEIAGWVQMNGAQAAQKITVEIPEAGIHEAITTDGTGLASFRFPAKLELWSPGHPKLYDVVVKSGDDTVHDQIGFRTIEVQGTQHPAEWQADLLTRHLDARGSAVSRGARLQPRGRADSARLGEGSGMQLRALRPLPAQRKRSSSRRPNGIAGVVGDPCLLGHRLVESCDAVERRGAIA